MNENNVKNQTTDFSMRARTKRFLRANKKNIIVLSICGILLVILLAIVIISAAIDSDDYITLENYNKIELGMTYNEVVKLLENHVGESVGNGTGSSVYTWKDDEETRFIYVTFDRRGIAYNKKQRGLE